MLWHIQIEPAPGHADRLGERLALEAVESGLAGPWSIRTSRGFLIEGRSREAELERAARDVLVDPVVETYTIRPSERRPGRAGTVVHVMPKPGVTDPEAESALALLRDLGYAVSNVRTIRTYRIDGPAGALAALDPARAGQRRRRAGGRSARCRSISSARGSPIDSSRVEVPIRALDDQELCDLSRSGQLALSLAEMKAIQRHFAELGREPTDCELETLAQTWSEHCSHKTLRGRIAFRRADDRQLAQADDLPRDPGAGLRLAGERLHRQRGGRPVRRRARRLFQGRDAQPSLGHRPLRRRQHGTGRRDPRRARDRAGGQADLQHRRVLRGVARPGAGASFPPGVLHPKRVLKGVVAGVRDYGNRMGIPTVNGALAVDPGYLANPLVFCGTVGVLAARQGGQEGRAGRPDRRDRRPHRPRRNPRRHLQLDRADGPERSGFGRRRPDRQRDHREDGARRDRPGARPGLFHAITDCGAGGFSSAVGEMGAELGAEVDLEKAPLKYQGLSYTEIWISEAQERMVLAVPPEKWPALHELVRQRRTSRRPTWAEFVDTGRLTLRYQGELVADLSMEFLHEGRPAVVREATWTPPEDRPLELPDRRDFTADLLALLAALGRLQQGMDRPPVRPRGPGADGRSSRWWDAATTDPATRR